MGNLVAAIRGLMHDLGSWMSIIGLILLPYGLIQQNFLYPNQFIENAESKYIFENGKPRNNWLKNDFSEDYSINIQDLKNMLEKGLFHLFGELFSAEVSSLQTEPPDRSECVLPLGRKADQFLCPETVS